MAGPAKNRVWASLTDDESAALEMAAKVKGMRPVDLVRAAILTYIRTPPQSAQAAVSPGIDPSIMTRLEALADKLEQKTQALQVALDVAYASDAERKDVREALTDIAMSIGVLAGSIEPVADGDNF
jgi:hypothetical protein